MRSATHDYDRTAIGAALLAIAFAGCSTIISASPSAARDGKAATLSGRFAPALTSASSSWHRGPTAIRSFEQSCAVAPRGESRAIWAPRLQGRVTCLQALAARRLLGPWTRLQFGRTTIKVRTENCQRRLGTGARFSRRCGARARRTTSLRTLRVVTRGELSCGYRYTPAITAMTVGGATRRSSPTMAEQPLTTCRNGSLARSPSYSKAWWAHQGSNLGPAD